MSHTEKSYPSEVLQARINKLKEWDKEALEIKENDPKQFLEYKNYYENNMEEHIYLIKELEQAIEVLEKYRSEFEVL